VAIYDRDEVSPEWEGVPWPLTGLEADAQETGFHTRAGAAIVWIAIDWNSFPAEGIFGLDRSWFSGRDVRFVASTADEDLLLIHNSWFGFPDPPEWGLASRPSTDQKQPWRHWGHFSRLPSAWTVPGEEESDRLLPR
jgi:hypothetical protein